MWCNCLFCRANLQKLIYPGENERRKFVLPRYVPDETWQSVEVTHRLVFGTGEKKTALPVVLRSLNYLFWLRLRLSKSSGAGSGPGPDYCFVIPVITDIILKSGFFMFFNKEYPLIHTLDPIQYEFLFLFTT
jgi:hypothetical protein